MGKYVAVWGDLARAWTVTPESDCTSAVGMSWADFAAGTLGHPRKWCDSNRGGEGVLARQLSREDETSGGGIAAAVTTT